MTDIERLSSYIRRLSAAIRLLSQYDTDKARSLIRELADEMYVAICKKRILEAKLLWGQNNS